MSDETAIYNVVINDAGQYSIWPADRPNAPGWRDVGKSGTKEECLQFIQQAWMSEPEPVEEAVPED
jgi:MbtH protein